MIHVEKAPALGGGFGNARAHCAEVFGLFSVKPDGKLAREADLHILVERDGDARRESPHGCSVGRGAGRHGDVRRYISEKAEVALHALSAVLFTDRGQRRDRLVDARHRRHRRILAYEGSVGGVDDHMIRIHRQVGGLGAGWICVLNISVRVCVCAYVFVCAFVFA